MHSPETLIREFSDRGSLVRPEAVRYLREEADCRHIRSVLGTSAELPMVVTTDDLRQMESQPGAPPAGLDIPDQSVKAQPAIHEGPDELPTPVRIVRDVTGDSTCAGDLKDFTRYFNSRYDEVRKMLRRRRELAGAVPIDRIGRRKEVKLIGIVNEVRDTRNGHRLFELEDASGVAPVLAPKDDPEAMEMAGTLLEDEVVGVVGTMARNASPDDPLVILRNLVRPDVPHRNEAEWGDEPCGVMFVSDTHIGSRTFLEDAWRRFVRWLDGERGNEEQRRLAQRVRYLVISGDIAEGIGIYPGQEDELAISDIYEQYEEAARLLGGIPDRIETFVMPGNHDAVRPAEPQPAFPDAIKGLFPDRFTFVGNPCTLEINGVEILAYHGRSFDDFITQMSGLEYSKPMPIMREMLRRRHLCPMYGAKTPVAPEKEDHLLIRDTPDVFVTGHGHSCDMGRYRGVTLVNASTWQSQTPFQRMMRYKPDPAKACFVDTGTGEKRILSFR